MLADFMTGTPGRDGTLPGHVPRRVPGRDGTHPLRVSRLSRLSRQSRQAADDGYVMDDGKEKPPRLSRYLPNSGPAARHKATRRCAAGAERGRTNVAPRAAGGER
jgi:hypothetical protein